MRMKKRKAEKKQRKSLLLCDREDSGSNGMNFSFFQNRECEYFPCHQTLREEDFNCLFCYCPLYSLPQCGGNAKFLQNGSKDCSACLFPHERQNYAAVIKKLAQNRD